MKSTKNADPDKYGGSSYGIGFDACSQFSWSDGSCCKNVVNVGADRSSSVLVDNKYKDILNLGESLTRELDDTTITAETKYLFFMNFAKSGKRLVLSLHYNESNS